MTKLIHGIYNMDTNCVELTYSDGSFMTIDCEKVENFYGITTGQMADLNWLVYHAPMESPGWCCLENFNGISGVQRNTGLKMKLFIKHIPLVIQASGMCCSKR